MDKKLLRFLATFVMMLLCISMVAMAAPGITGSTSVNSGVCTTTVNVTGVGTTDKVTLLVVKAGTDLTDFTSEDIYYAAQKSASSGTASFQFVTNTNRFDVYSGYSIKPRTQDPLSIKHSGVPDIASGSKIYESTAPFGIEGCRRVFIKLTNENGNWIPSHSGEGSEIYYSTELGGYDGLIKTTAADVNSIYYELGWIKGTPSADATITKYGDVTDDGEINVADYVSIRKAILGSTKYNAKKYLTADVSDDASLKIADYIAIRKNILGSLKEFLAITNRK